MPADPINGAFHKYWVNDPFQLQKPISRQVRVTTLCHSARTASRSFNQRLVQVYRALFRSHRKCDLLFSILIAMLVSRKQRFDTQNRYRHQQQQETMGHVQFICLSKTLANDMGGSSSSHNRATNTLEGEDRYQYCCEMHNSAEAAQLSGCLVIVSEQ